MVTDEAPCHNYAKLIPRQSLPKIGVYPSTQVDPLLSSRREFLFFKKMTEHAKAGNFAKASSEVFKLLEINGPMYEEGNPTGLKYLMSLMNLCGPYYRLPLVEPSAALKKKIEKAFAKITV